MSKIKLTGESSGYVEISAGANAGNNTLDLPSGKVKLVGADSSDNIVVGIVTASGDITAVNASFSGDVSVGGVLTYDDVTNIDSVGIVTARSGIHVTSGSVGIGTDNPAGKLHISSGDSGDCVMIIEADTDNNDENDNPKILFRQDGGNDWSAISQGNNELTLSNSVSSGGIIFQTGSSNGYTNASERLRITSGGLVGIATAVPSYRLDIGDGATDPANGYQLRVNAAGDYIFALQRQSVPSFSIRNNSTGIVHLNTQNIKILSLGVSSGNASGSIEDDVRIDSNGHLTIVDGNLVVASGHGIDFSATGNGSGTMSSELLDDYEEGSWTPIFKFTGGSTGITYSSSGGLYTRVGRLVTCYCVIVLSNKGSSTGNAYVQGLPYTATDLVAGTSLEGGGHALYQDNTVGTHVGPIQAAVINNQSYFDLYRITSTSPGHSDVVTDGNVANNSSYRFVLQYTAA